ncbi:MAG: hypothetical protein KBG29_11570 [Pseudomonadales bacterium]|nr:hypothetical protein [Pseudomonadales bacterium]
MALQLSVAARNALLDAIETTIGTAPYLDIRTGAQPADCAQADAGTELEHMALPSDWLAAASGGTKAKAGTWTGTADAAGTAAHFRVKDTADTNCHMQGSVTATGGGGQLELDNVVIASGQTITITAFTLTAPNA